MGPIEKQLLVGYVVILEIRVAKIRSEYKLKIKDSPLPFWKENPPIENSWHGEVQRDRLQDSLELFYYNRIIAEM